MLVKCSRQLYPLFSIGSIYSEGSLSSSMGERNLLAELSLENPAKSISEKERGANEIADSLVGVEALYILAANPATTREVVSRLRTNFGLDAETDQIRPVLANLITRKLIRNFGSLPGQVTPLDSFSITPLGLSTLSKWLESLSEITLTMQLGLSQRLVVAEE